MSTRSNALDAPIHNLGRTTVFGLPISNLDPSATTVSLYWEGDSYLRVLIDETRGIVDLVMNNHVQVLLGIVFRNVGVGKFFRHDGRWKRGRSAN
jgi:hypothetical protein